MPIRAVGFDYLGVTAHLSGRNIFEIIGERLAVSPGLVQQAYKRFNVGFQQGNLSHDQLWESVAKVLNRSGDLSLILTTANENVPQIDTEVLSLIDEVRTRGYKTGLLSNMSTGTPWDEALYAQGVNRHFDAVILSGDLGIAKPDLRAYHALTKALNVALDELVFIDDRKESMHKIDEAGVIPIVFTGVEPLRFQLHALGILTSQLTR